MDLAWEIHVRLQSDTPVIGIELNPHVHVNYEGGYCTPPNYSVEYAWFRKKLVQEHREAWIQVGSSKTYIPLEEDLDSSLKLESIAIDEKGIKKSPKSIFFTAPVIMAPPTPSRKMTIFCSPKRLMNLSTKPFKDGSFMVLSYNILADLYSIRESYSHCPKWALTWEYRRQNLMKEMISHDADILCLQEVQNDHFEDFFKPMFASMGYSAIYKKKTNEVFSGISNQYIMDGCATFFRDDRFKMVKKYEVEYDKFAPAVIEKLEADRRNEGIFRLMKGNVALVVILEEKGNCNSQDDGSRSRICVANTHIHCGSNAHDVRLFQVINLIRGLEKIDSAGIPVLICGDMNSRAGSDPHRFFINGEVGGLRHQMHLASAYERPIDQRTDLLSNFKTSDYIFYSEDMLKSDWLLKPMDEDHNGKRLLPSPAWSSDHVALMANFRIRRAFRGQQCLSPPVDPWEQKQTC